MVMSEQLTISPAMAGRFQIGSYPDTVTGTPFVEMTEEKYKRRYAVGVCMALQKADPQTFNSVFGSLENCVRQAGAFADFNFDKWKISWPTNLSTAIATFG